MLWSQTQVLKFCNFLFVKNWEDKFTENSNKSITPSKIIFISNLKNRELFCSPVWIELILFFILTDITKNYTVTLLFTFCPEKYAQKGFSCTSWPLSQFLCERLKKNHSSRYRLRKHHFWVQYGPFAMNEIFAFHQTCILDLLWELKLRRCESRWKL